MEIMYDTYLIIHKWRRKIKKQRKRRKTNFQAQKTKKPAAEGWLFHLVKEFLPGSLFG